MASSTSDRRGSGKSSGVVLVRSTCGSASSSALYMLLQYSTFLEAKCRKIEKLMIEEKRREMYKEIKDLTSTSGSRLNVINLLKVNTFTWTARSPCQRKETEMF